MLHPTPSNLSAIVANSRPYMEQMVDADGLPYFNAFLTTPVVMAHDWPDFGDVMSRQYQAAVMYRHMTGNTLATESIWRDKILALLDPTDGLLYRPATTFSQHVADSGDQALTLYALATACLDNPTDEMRQAVSGMVRGIQGRMDTPAYHNGFLLKPLLAAWRVLQDSATWALIEQLTQILLADPRVFPPDDVYPPHTHVHGTLRTLCGIVDYARLTDNQALIARAERLGRFIRNRGTSFGFLPESVDRPSDIISCETCALMDYVGLAVSLANAGYVEYWAEVERVVRNQLTESQAHDLDWLPVDNQRPDTYQFSWRDLTTRLVGSYAGWSSPTHFLAAEETLNAHWGGPELRDKARLLQNCCGGSGIHAFFIAWKNIARYQDGRLTVALHMDKSTPQAEIRCQQPYQGLLSVRLLRECSVSLRLPEGVTADQAQLTCNGQPVPFTLDGQFLHVGSQPANSLIEMRYPLAQRTEEVCVGNPGYQQYRYQVTWKGDTVIAMQPIGDMPQTAWSNYDQKPVPVYYGEEGPGRLYQRQGYLASEPPQPGALHQDDDSLDLW